MLILPIVTKISVRTTYRNGINKQEKSVETRSHPEVPKDHLSTNRNKIQYDKPKDSSVEAAVRISAGNHLLVADPLLARQQSASVARSGY